MVPKAALVLIAILSWLATAAITLTVLTVGPIAQDNTDQGGVLLTAADETDIPDAPDNALPRLGLMPVFSLTNQHGQPFGLNDLRGKVWVVDTVFTRCSAICPTLTAGMKQVQDALKRDPRFADHVRIVSISIDGHHDTPEVLKQYANAYQADPERWLFLTGDPAEVWPFIQDGLKLPVEPGPPGDDLNILHSGKILLIDRAGTIRGYYDGLTNDGRIKLLTDLSRLLDEK